jgi:hypothetical protein
VQNVGVQVRPKAMASPHGGLARASGIRTFLIADIRGCTYVTAGHGDEAWGGELVELRGDSTRSAPLQIAAAMCPSDDR